MTAPSPTPPPAPAPGWYPDPDVPGQQRMWDGQWTDLVRSIPDRSASPEYPAGNPAAPTNAKPPTGALIFVALIGIAVVLWGLLSKVYEVHGSESLLTHAQLLLSGKRNQSYLSLLDDFTLQVMAVLLGVVAAFWALATAIDPEFFD